jgi:hypothetical protein
MMLKLRLQLVPGTVSLEGRTASNFADQSTRLAIGFAVDL